MEKKAASRGRQKIQIEKIERESDCYATFSKRRVGLLKKASELSSLCNADVGAFIFSPTGKPFTFFHPSMESVVTQFMNPDYQPDDADRLLDAYTRTRVLQLNEMLEKMDEQIEHEMARWEKLQQMDDGKNCLRLWEEPVENLDKEQVQQLTGLLENLQAQLTSRRERLLKKPVHINID